ncbi:MAG: LCP family protein [Eubacteriales bacterium]|nr:LCP family protein [Eubacteriales bacterium]
MGKKRNDYDRDTDTYYNDSHKGRKSKKKKKIKLPFYSKVILLIMGILILIALSVALWLQVKLSKINRVDPSKDLVLAASEQVFERDSSAGSDTMKPEEVNFNNADIEVMSDASVKNILLIGQDARGTDTGRQRSDTMIICSLNTKTGEITLVSLMRDLYVPIPGYESNRINSAYVLGGMTLLDQLIEEDFGVHIDGNVEVNFDGFIEALTVVGELEIELTEEEATYMNTYPGLGSSDDRAKEVWALLPGKNSLTPTQTLCYSRMRYVGNSDYERTERQRKVVTAAFNKVVSGSASELMSLADSILPCITTDMANSEILGYVYTVITKGLQMAERSHRLPVDGLFSSESIRGMSVLVPDLEANSMYLYEVLYNHNTNPNIEDIRNKSAGIYAAADPEPVAADPEPAEQQAEESGTYGTADDASGSTGYDDNVYNTGVYDDNSQGDRSDSIGTYNPNETEFSGGTYQDGMGDAYEEPETPDVQDVPAPEAPIIQDVPVPETPDVTYEE